jgi:hypothetical protein
MIRFLASAAAAALVLGAAAPASATTFDPTLGAKLKQRLKDEVKSFQTYATSAQLDRWVLPDSAYSGVGGLFIQTASGGGFICSGSLIAPGLVLTAAHCLDSPDVSAISFFLPSYRNSNGTNAGREVLSANGFLLHPDYNLTDNGVLGNGDLALVSLARPAGANREIYSLYGGTDELDNLSYQRVGTGTLGLGRVGTFPDETNFDLRKRAGLNVYEFDFGSVVDSAFGFAPGETGCGLSEFFGFSCTNTLVYDFDSGRARNDVFGLYMGKPGLGLRYNGVLVDSNSSPGDSGGPTFINGQIAGITSFGLTGSIFEPGNCGGNSVDVTADSTGFCTNASYGELSGDTRVSAYRDWLDPFVTRFSDPNRPPLLSAARWLPLGGVPEPSTWMMLIAGFGAVGIASRRQRAREAAAS